MQKHSGEIVVEAFPVQGPSSGIVYTCGSLRGGLGFTALVSEVLGSACSTEGFFGCLFQA